MTGRYSLEDVRRQRAEIGDVARRLLRACNGGHARIGAIVHGHAAGTGLPCTACGVRWVPADSPVFPRGEPTDEPVDCMSCLARMTGS